MKLHGYGEDALTLWALTSQMGEILRQLEEETAPEDCDVFYRPSFGRRGGNNSAQFGEFDFIILAGNCIYLGESKWDGSSLNIVDGTIELADNQSQRHEIFRAYIQQWAFGEYQDWEDFRTKAQLPYGKPVPKAKSLLARNLRLILGKIRHRYGVSSAVKNVLLYCHRGIQQPPGSASDEFKLVVLDYSGAMEDGIVTWQFPKVPR